MLPVNPTLSMSTISPPHLHSGQGVLHQHRDGQGSDAAGHRCQMTGHLSHFTGIHVADLCKALLFKCSPALRIVAEKPFEVGLSSHAVRADINHGRSWLNEG